MFFLFVISGFIGIWFLSFLVSMWKINYAPNSWRRMMLRKIYFDTVKHCRRGVSLQVAHNIVVNKWHMTCLYSKNQKAFMLFTEMMKDELPKQIEMLCKKMYGENYNVKYGDIKNKEQLLEIIESERHASGGISNFEKMCIDRVLPSLPSVSNEEELLEIIPHIFLGVNEMGWLPTTFEEVNTYLKQKLNVQDAKSSIFICDSN